MDSKQEKDTISHAAPEINEEVEGPNKAITRGRDVDDALRFALDNEDLTWTEDEEKTVRWRIDFVILPLLFLSAIIGYSDSQAYGFAAIFGLIQDMNLYTLGPGGLDLSKYSFSAAISTLGAAAGQFPLLFIAQYFSYGKFNSLFVIYAGLLAILHITCHNFSQIMALRFFFGFSTITQPLSIIITSMWWKTNEQPVRMGLYIAGSGLGNLVGQGIDFGAVTIKGAYATSPWKWIYVILGSVTMGYGIIAFILFPASPMKAWFLNDRQKAIAVRRLIQNQTGVQTRAFKWKQVREAFMDPQLYLLGIYSWSFAFVNNALGSFGGFLVTSFGYSNKGALLMSMPASAIAVVSMVLSGILGSMFPRRRILIAMLFILPSIIGNALLWKSPRENKHALFAGLYIGTTFYGALVQEFALLAANISGHTKKTVINAFIVVLANLGGFAGPWAYHGNEAAQGYPTGQISALNLLCACEGAFALLWLYYFVQNKKKASLREEWPELTNDPNMSFVDLTDQENPVFRYAC